MNDDDKMITHHRNIMNLEVVLSVANAGIVGRNRNSSRVQIIHSNVTTPHNRNTFTIQPTPLIIQIEQIEILVIAHLTVPLNHLLKMTATEPVLLLFNL
jgi:hypothetical protein